MAFLFCDSFDHYQQSDMPKKWDVLSGTLGTHMGLTQDLTAPGGGNAYYVAAINANSWINRQLATTTTGYSTMIVGTWFQVTAFGQNSTTNAILSISDDGGTTIQCSVGFTAAGRIGVYRGGATSGTLLGTLSTNVLQMNTWYHIEMKATIHNTTGQYEVRVNGSSVGWVPQSAANQNTRNGSVNQGSGLAIYAQPNQNSMKFKSPYALDTSGTVGNDFIGPCRVAILRPGAAGTTTNFNGMGGSNYAAVDEQYMDWDYTFTQATSVSSIDTYVTDDVPSATTASIIGLQHVIACKQEPGAARTFGGVTRIGSTNYVATSQWINAPTSWMFMCQPMPLSPATSAQWTVAEVNAAEFGYKVVT